MTTTAIQQRRIAQQHNEHLVILLQALVLPPLASVRVAPWLGRAADLYGREARLGDGRQLAGAIGRQLLRCDRGRRHTLTQPLRPGCSAARSHGRPCRRLR